jgi:hypothetical protein
MNIKLSLQTMVQAVREQTEAIISNASKILPVETKDDLHSLIYELEVKKIELQIQNEELR